MRRWQLRQMQSLPLPAKIVKSKQRIREWYEYWDGNVGVSFSGGKDSTVLLHLVRVIYPEVPALFVDTGLEYPEIRQFVKNTENVSTVKPTMKFREVIREKGYPVATKKVARMVSVLQNPTPKNRHSRRLYLTGIKRNGERSHYFKLPRKWHKLIDAPFRVSDACCYIMKIEPFGRHEKATGQKQLAGTMATDSERREHSFLQRGGCNSFKHGVSLPLSFWDTQDILRYITEHNIPYCPVYGDIVEQNGKLKTTAEHNTGCMFCMFGVHLESGENRFQRMARTHPKLYQYCIDELEIGEVLDYIGVNYRPVGKQLKLFESIK